MLETDSIQVDGKPHEFYSEVRDTQDMLMAMQFWTARFARDLLQFGVFLRAAAIMLQVTGGPRFKYVTKNPDDDENNITDQIRGEDPEMLVHVLANCLERLKASPKIMEQVPGGEDYEREKLSEEWTAFLDSQAKVEFGLVNVVVEILDELIVRPETKAIDVVPAPTWWQVWWERIGAVPP